MILEGSPNPARGTRRVALAIVLVALAWGGAFRARIVLASGLAGAATLALLALAARLSARGVAFTRAATTRAFEDDELEVSFALENRGLLPILHAEVEDRFAPDQDPFRRAPMAPWLGPRSRAASRYRATCFGKRGSYEIGPALVRVADPLGLFPVDVVREELAPLVVYPRAVELPGLPSRGRGLPFASSASTRTPGISVEALSVREYRPGDPLRRIHWPTTARRGRLAVLELEQEHARDVAIVIDLDRRVLRGLGRRSTLEHSVRIAASAAATHTKRGDRVQLVARGKDPVLVPAGTGERHLALLLEELAHVKPDGETPLAQVLEEAAPLLAPGSTVLVVIAGTEPVVSAVAALRARGCEVVAVLLDERTFFAIYREQQRGDGARASVPEAADALVLEGALVYVVGQGADLASCFLAPYRRGGA